MAPDGSISCGLCKTKLKLVDKNVTKCEGKCRKVFHNKCLPENAQKPDENGFISDFFCETCNANKRENSRSPSGSSPKKNRRDEKALETEIPEADMPSFEGEDFTKLAQWMTKINETMMQQMRKQTNIIRSSVDNANKRIDNNCQIIDQLETANEELRNNNEELRKRADKIESDLNYIQQRELSKRIEIAGIPLVKNEKLKEVVIKVAKTMKIHLQEDKIINVYRKKFNAKIWVKLESAEIASKMIEESFKQKPTSTPWIGDQTNQNDKNKNAKTPIFVNNALTPMNQLIYKKLRDLKADNKITKINFRNSRSKIRTTTTSNESTTSIKSLKMTTTKDITDDQEIEIKVKLSSYSNINSVKCEKKSFKIMHLNARSMNNKMDKIKWGNELPTI